MKRLLPPIRMPDRRTLLATGLGAAMVGAGILSTCSPRVPLLTRIGAMGVLRVATLNTPTTYYVGTVGPTGFEYDLTQALAQDLGVHVEILVADSPAEALQMVANGRAHLAAGLAINPEREKALRFSSPLRKVTPELVYRSGHPRPKSLDDLQGRLRVAADSEAAQTLKELAAEHPGLKWEETDDLGAEELLFQVASDDLDYTLAPSDLVAVNQRSMPQLRSAFSLPRAQNIAWGFAPGDDSLFDAASEFIARMEHGELASVRDRYFSPIARSEQFSALALATRAQTRLPRYRGLFEKAAARYGLDWRLLASVGYQESLWDPHAVSYTGVRGLMQLTTDTADFLNVKDRLDPVQSIHGAARYLQQLHNALPPDVQEPDRTWLTLAAYNCGIGHTMDAREITRLRNGDPNRWSDVRNNFLLLTQPKWYRKTRYGYARGQEAVTYVTNVRSFYDMLSWITGETQPARSKVDTEDTGGKKKKKKEEPLNIKSPIL
jgi:membrane-bound lytic murein transglycosylase F